ncbi:MAG: redoxin domain-containing protein [Cyclobacteriaceae bacterium]|nr:redoxin domain-containing protein [Cyclobacteriaceae bacterium]
MKNVLLAAGLCMLAISFTFAQQGVNQRIPLLGSEAPSFSANSTHGIINFPKDFGKNWKILFAHPKAFTPVCSSEILELAHAQAEFDKMGAKVIVASVDRLDSHVGWKLAMEQLNYKNRGQIDINFPLVDDYSCNISNLYGMLDSDNITGQSIRGVFFVDPDNKISAFYFYPVQVGRNIEEIKRTLEALQASRDNSRVLLPANWKQGDDVMVPFMINDESAFLGQPDSNIYQLAWFMTYLKSK